MKFLHTAAFAVILAVAGAPLLLAQEPDQDKEKPKPQEEDKKKQPPPPRKEKPQEKPDERRKPEPDKDKPKTDSEEKNQPQKENDRADRREQDRPEAGRKEGERHGQRTNARRIPEESFHASFGREHHFHVERRDDRQFQYGGYVFEFVDPWPADWSDEDDYYVEADGDDYYLVDVRHPGVRILVVIVG